MSASFSMMAKFSSEPTPRPPETTILAEASSGRSEAATLSSTQAEVPGSAPPPAVSIGQGACSPVASKLAPRTVTTFFASLDCTVWMALPA